MEGVRGADMNRSPSTTTPGDSSAMSPSVRPTPGAVAWATDGMGHANTSGNAVVTPSYDPFITVAATSTCISGVMTSCVVPTTVGAMSAVGSLVCPVVGNGIMAISSCSVMSEGDP